MNNIALEPGLVALRDALDPIPREKTRQFDSWQETLLTLFPATFTVDFSEAQAKFWSWLWAIEENERPNPYTLIIPRGGGKTTSCEVAGILLGCFSVRRYCWYIQETQTQVDKRISTIAEKLESVNIARYFPLMSDRWTGKFGNIGGWRRSFVRTASNVVFEAVGLDKAARSSKVGDQRPDIVIIDDIDNKYDTPKAIKRKLDTLTHTLLPALDAKAVIIFAQNLIHSGSIASKLCDRNNIDFLQDRIISGPYPALLDFETERIYNEELDRDQDIIVKGTPLWEGQGIEECQDYINTYGLTSFRTECQQEVEKLEGSIWEFVKFNHCDSSEVPDLLVGCVWCDPAVTETDKSDCQAIIADGLAVDGTLYRLLAYEERSSPLVAVKIAILWAVELGFGHVGIETDQGGDTWKTLYETAWEQLIADPSNSIGHTTPKPKFHEDKAGAGYGSKAHRNNLMLSIYETHKVVHVRGSHTLLEGALNRFLIKKPYDLADAAFWSSDFLINKKYLGRLADAR